jgi:deoxyribodipyrimidine photolyase-related protein
VRTVWVLGDQLNRDIASLRGRNPGDTRVLLVESEALLASKRWHVARLHLVVTAMRRFALELERAGFEVDHRRAPNLAAGVEQHRHEHRPSDVVAMAPRSWDGRALSRRLGVTSVPNDQFLCHEDDFAAWADARAAGSGGRARAAGSGGRARAAGSGGRARAAGRLRMEDFYRWQRVRLGVLMDGDEPAGGRWNYDDENREPPPRDGRPWPGPVRSTLDELDRRVLAELRARPNVWGDDPGGLWPTSRRAALVRLRRFVDEALPVFGPHEDAMLHDEWRLAHSLLAAPLNLGLLHPGEVVAAAETAYRQGRVPIASAEGFIRQVLGWREYVWGLYWRWMPAYRDQNELGADRPLPPLFATGETHMRCVTSVLEGVRRRGWSHHVERLMVLGNLAMLAGVRPAALVEWMWASFVDGAEWVMLPNVVGMALHADGGRMATKPYAAGGAYLDRMSDHCRGCRYDPKRRTGDDACPFTTLYWDFLDRHRDRFAGNHRMGNQLAGLRRLADLDATRARASEVLAALDAGTL